MIIKYNNKIVLVMYLLGFPIAGALVGLLSIFLLTLVGTTLNSSLCNIIVASWVLYGFYLGYIGAKTHFKIDKLHKIHTKQDSQK